MQKTSDSHPLEIATLSLPDGKGQIGVTLCPGTCDQGLSSGPWRRDLAKDMTAIRLWGADALLSLVEDAELDKLQVPRLGEAAEAAGLEWHHLPIADMSVPNWAFTRRWAYTGVRLRRLLRRGGRVVIHCRAGLGRAGMIAAQLLVELGTPAAEAISQVRRARPGAIQTAAQAVQVEKAARIFAADDEAVAKRLACLLGGALGDAFGYVVEFDKQDAIQRKFGLGGLQQPPVSLVVSDDTQMSLFTLEGLTRAGHADESDAILLAEIRRSYLDWLETQGEKSGDGTASRLMKHATLHVRRAPGNTCLTALLAGGRGTPEAPINDSKGCGGVMRVAPVAFVAGMTPQRAFQLGMASAALTHGHPGGYLPAGVLAATLCSMLNGEPLHASLKTALQMAQTFPGHEETLLALEAAQRAALHPYLGKIPETLGLGWVGEEALAIGVYAALCSLEFATAARIAANHDGDSDSTASIAGQLFAAQYGLESLPHAWIRRLDVLDALCDVVDWARPLWVKNPGGSGA